MNSLNVYAAISRFGALNYRLKIMLVAFLGTHIPLLAILGYYVLSTTSDMSIVIGTLLVGLVATLIGTGITLFVLNALLQPVLMTSKALRTYRASREIMPLPTRFTDEAGTLMADAATTLTRLEATLVELETIDGVTGLPNREKFLAELRRGIAAGSETAVTVIGIDNVSRVAATYDQATANAYVRSFAAELAAASGDSIVGRVGAGAFAILRPAGDSSVSAFSAGLVASLAKPIAIGKVDVMPDLRAGIAVMPDDGTEAEALLDAAVAAAAMVNTANKVSFHSAQARDRARDRFSLEQEMRRALKDSEFRLHYQPVVDLTRGRAVGAEALIRWQHPERGLVSPGMFIPAAERSGMIDEIGLWVMREACAQAGRWQGEGLGDMKVAVNLSARQFLDPHLTDLLAEALAVAKVPGDRLEIELTESAAMVDADYTRKAFGKLSDIGVSIAIDDFGTGYASMSYLRKLPFNKLKIDREFVTNVDSSAGSQAIVNAMIALGQGLNLEILAEGTERMEEVSYLASRGCSLFQGYYFARPVPAEDFAATIVNLGTAAKVA